MNKEYGLLGAKEIYDALNELSEKVKDQLLQSFNRKAASSIIVPALRTVPWKSARNSIKVQGSRDDKTAITTGISTDAYWIRFVDGGTKDRLSKGGKSKGKIEARNIIGPILDSQIEPIIDFVNNDFGNQIGAFLEKKIKRLNKQLEK